jgi:hypothetical protein
MRAAWTGSGACTSGSTGHPRVATRRGSGSAATTSTTTLEACAVPPTPESPTARHHHGRRVEPTGDPTTEIVVRTRGRWRGRPSPGWTLDSGSSGSTEAWPPRPPSPEPVRTTPTARPGSSPRRCCFRPPGRPRARPRWRALADRSSRPDRCPHQVPPHIEARIVAVRRAHLGWGFSKASYPPIFRL